MPDSYVRHIFKDVADSQSKNRKLESSITDENGTTFLTIEDEIKNYRKSFEPLIYNSLTEDYPDNIRTANLVIEKIISKKIKGNDAYFQVNLRSSKNYNRELFFFLHKEGQTWKIFYITDLIFSDNFPY